MLTTREIIKTMEDIADVGIVNYKQTEAVKAAIPHLKKILIPRLPKLEKLKYPKPGHHYNFYCPNCGHGVTAVAGTNGIANGGSHCSSCGQWLDWKYWCRESEWEQHLKEEKDDGRVYQSENTAAGSGELLSGGVRNAESGAQPDREAETL